MPGLPKSKYDSKGRPINNSSFKSNSNLNNSLMIKRHMYFIIILAFIYFVVSFKLDLSPSKNVFYFIIIIIFAYIEFKQMGNIFRNSRESEYSYIKPEEGLNKNLDKYEDDESDFDQEKADKLIEEFNKR